jgi:uncharacterized membrane protein YidH (DUF202 family)
VSPDGATDVPEPEPEPEEAARTADGIEPGMAAERTDLAWSRSGVALLGCGVIVLKGLPTVSGDTSRPVAGMLILSLGALTWGLGRWSAHAQRAQIGTVRGVARWRDLAPTAMGTASVGTAALLLALFRPG